MCEKGDPPTLLRLFLELGEEEGEEEEDFTPQ